MSTICASSCGVHGTQAMRRNAQPGARRVLQHGLAALDQLRVVVDAGYKPLLIVTRTHSAEGGVRVEHWQQRQRDAGAPRGRDQPAGHLGDVGVGPALDVMMQVLELANPAEAGLHHLHVGLARHCLQLLGPHARGEAVHGLAPTPEIVCCRAAQLGKPGHATLKCVAVQVLQSLAPAQRAARHRARASRRPASTRCAPAPPATAQRKATHLVSAVARQKRWSSKLCPLAWP